ncbi:MAG: nuclear transport factor 2 family protein [Gammaproteobacteria bacterium]|nr:nuclear transport factor 2 family protein [Gammaproteobacteria bacterium]
MTTQFQQVMNGMIEAIHSKDLESLMGYFGEEAELYDPHYPMPKMKGKYEISCGLKWAFGGIKKFGFTVEQVFVSQDANKGAVEINTSHVMKTGQKMNFSQVFVVELQDGKISRMHAYVPYGPGGANGFVLALIRFFRRFIPRKPEWATGEVAGARF